MKDVKIYNRKLEAEDVEMLYYARKAKYLLDGEWLFDERAGLVAYDTSENGNDGVITGAKWSDNIPTEKRKKNDGNMVYNGDFEIQPPGNEPTTVGNRWVDGTNGGDSDSLKNLIGIHSGSRNGAEIELTTKDGYKCLHIGLPYIDLYGIVRSNTRYQFANQRDNAFKLKPNTEYKFSGWVKVENASGDSGGATLSVNISNVDGNYTQYARALWNSAKTNQDWTYYEEIFTTDADGVAGNVQMTVYGHTGAKTLVGDWYFRDIVLKEV